MKQTNMMMGLVFTVLVGVLGCGAEAPEEASATGQIEQGALSTTDPLLGSWRSSGGWIANIDGCGCAYLTVTQDQTCTPVGMKLYDGLYKAADGNYYGMRSLGPCNGNRWVNVRISLSSDNGSYTEYPEGWSVHTWTRQ